MPGITEETAIKKCPSVLTPPNCISNDHLTTTEPPNYYNQPVYESDCELSLFHRKYRLSWSKSGAFK